MLGASRIITRDAGRLNQHHRRRWTHRSASQAILDALISITRHTGRFTLSRRRYWTLRYTGNAMYCGEGASLNMDMPTLRIM